jgi:hypothetical protein
MYETSSKKVLLNSMKGLSGKYKSSYPVSAHFTSQKSKRAVHFNGFQLRQGFDFTIGQPKLCLIFNSKKMKRILFVSMFVIASLVQFSCTDDIATAKDNKATVVANTAGDPITVPPIKP